MAKNQRACTGMGNWPNFIILMTQKPLENKQALTIKGILPAHSKMIIIQHLIAENILNQSNVIKVWM